MGPFAAAYLAYKKGEVRSKQEMPAEVMLWILALGGAGIVVGLATYGYKIMNAMGVGLRRPPFAFVVTAAARWRDLDAPYLCPFAAMASTRRPRGRSCLRSRRRLDANRTRALDVASTPGGSCPRVRRRLDANRPRRSSSPPLPPRAARVSSWARPLSSSTGRVRAGRSVPLIARSVRRWQLGCFLCGNQPASPRHRRGVASMAWMSTRRFSANAP